MAGEILPKTILTLTDSVASQLPCLEWETSHWLEAIMWGLIFFPLNGRNRQPNDSPLVSHQLSLWLIIEVKLISRVWCGRNTQKLNQSKKMKEWDECRFHDSAHVQEDTSCRERKEKEAEDILLHEGSPSTIFRQIENHKANKKLRQALVRLP